MILTITPNAALDRTLVVPGYGKGGVFRPEQLLVVAGGKGLNVARAARVLGADAYCCGFIAGYNGDLFASLAAQEGLAARWTRLADGETRICTVLVDPIAEQTSLINEAGVNTTPADWDRLHGDVLTVGQGADAICLCGSLPPGTPQGSTSPESLAALLTDLRYFGKPVWVDSSGMGLQTAVSIAGIHLKVNDHEASDLLGTTIHDATSAGHAALTLARQRSACAAITLGEQGAVISDGDGVWFVQPPTIEAKSAVGSGDAFLAGLLVKLTQGAPIPEALRWAAAAGTANTLSVGGGQFSRSDFERILSNTSIINQHV